MPIVCHNEPGHGPAVRGTLLCEACYQTALAKVRATFTRRSGSKESPSIRKGGAQPASASELEADRKLADVIARSVVAAGGPVTRLDKRLGMERDQRLTRAIALARKEGLIVLDNGTGFRAGPNAPPPPPSARAVADIVWSATGAVTYDELAGALRVSRRTLSRHVGPAREAGWIVNVHGTGYARGSKKPPENSEAR